MRTRLLLCLLVLLSCAKRINPEPGESRTTYSGVPVRFGEQQQIPEGAEILWDFGDGTPQEKGASVIHAFPRAGVYTVVETIRHADGQTRSARMPVHREIAAKLSLDAALAELARSVSEAAGFDVLDGKTAEANGFDPEE